jgi:hypothetical protein
LGYIVNTFVNVTIYPQYNNNIIKIIFLNKVTHPGSKLLLPLLLWNFRHLFSFVSML